MTPLLPLPARHVAIHTGGAAVSAAVVCYFGPLRPHSGHAAAHCRRHPAPHEVPPPQRESVCVCVCVRVCVSVCVTGAGVRWATFPIRQRVPSLNCVLFSCFASICVVQPEEAQFGSQQAQGCWGRTYVCPCYLLCLAFLLPCCAPVSNRAVLPSPPPPPSLQFWRARCERMRL